MKSFREAVYKAVDRFARCYCDYKDDDNEFWDTMHGPHMDGPDGYGFIDLSDDGIDYE